MPSFKGAEVSDRVAGRVRKNLDARDTLEVLRRGVEMLGMKDPLASARPD